jgi:hypothetical protein
MNAGATASTRSSLTNTEVPSAFTPVTTRLMDMDASLSTYVPRWPPQLRLSTLDLDASIRRRTALWS